MKDEAVALVVAGWTLSYLKVNYPYTDPKVEKLIAGINVTSLNNTNNMTKDNNNSEQEENGWLFHVNKALLECKRVLNAGGMLVIMETRGVAYDEPTRAGKLKHFNLFESSYFFQGAGIINI